MTDATARFSLPYIMPAQSQKHLTHNQALRQLDLFLHLSVIDNAFQTPPSAPQENDAYIIPVNATGDWSGRGGQVAVWIDGLWQFFLPVIGWVVWIHSKQLTAVFNGQEWASSTSNAGKSAYDIAVDAGFQGTSTDWLASLAGRDGSDGRDGVNGLDGNDGANGVDGADGQSAYEIAVSNGYSGTQSEWIASLRGDDGVSAAAKPFARVVNNDPTIAINSPTPVTILSAQLTLTEPSNLLISGVITGTFQYVSGVACYVNNSPISIGTGNNMCHGDCFMVLYGNGNDSYCCATPFETTTDELQPGTYTVDVAVLSHWNGTSRALYVNNRVQNDMASSSSMTIRAL
jgi:hypothetical protein